MDKSSQAHMQRFKNSCKKNREAEICHKATQFEKGEMMFDEERCVTKTKKPFMLKTEYFKVEEEKLVQAYIEESNPDRDNRTILYSKVHISNSSPLNICQFFSSAGQIKSIMITKDEIRKQFSAEIEFTCFKSVAVAVAMAVKDNIPNVCMKTDNIRVDSLPAEETKISEGGTDVSIVEVDAQKIHIYFSHIPMTVNWLEKIFGVFGVVQKIKIYRPDDHVHLGYAFLQFESIEGVQGALRLDKQLEFSHKNVEVKMVISALDGTKWEQNGKLWTPMDSKEDDGSL